VQKSAGKVLASIFWDQDSVPLIDYLPKGQTINVEYYSSLLVQLKEILTEKYRGKVIKGVLFLHNSAPAHWALVTQKKLAYLGFQCLDHPPYFPDLALSDYHLYPGLKKTIECSSFYVRRGGHCCRGDIVGRTTFLIFCEWLAKVRATC
jgi:histone-lysine N-methyltransferase SETMAR